MSDLFPAIGPFAERLFLLFDVHSDVDIYENFTSDERKEYFNTQGYCILRKVIDPIYCDEIVDSYRISVKTYRGALYRHLCSGRPEVHRVSRWNHIVNPLLNPHDLNSSRFGEFRHKIIHVLTLNTIHTLCSEILSVPPIMDQSVYQEVASITRSWSGSMHASVGKDALSIYVALEDVHPGAGRWFVYPRSHTTAWDRFAAQIHYAHKPMEYHSVVKSMIQQNKFVCHAPPLSKGDILVVNSNAIHGCLSATEPARSRHALRADYIPLINHTRKGAETAFIAKLQNYNQMLVHHPRDQNHCANRMRLLFESYVGANAFSLLWKTPKD